MYIEANMEEIERQKFNRELNISWVDENLPKADNAIILKHYFRHWLFMELFFCLSGLTLSFQKCWHIR